MQAQTVKERPILFSSEMVRAILEGRKTQTRRSVKQSPIASGVGWNVWYSDKIEGQVQDAGFVKLHCPYGVPGDRLWVRETWQAARGVQDHLTGEWDVELVDPKPGRPVIFRADADCPEEYAWRPSIFMPRWASRITLEITDVRVQRVQEISEEDAEAEGAPLYVEGHGPVSSFEISCDPGYLMYGRYKRGFEDLWDSINAKRGFGWQVNPWVWVISFRRIAG